MKRFILYILGGLITVIAVLLIIGSTRPKDMTIQRSIVIDAPLESVWVQVSDLHHYHEWNPYLRMEPDARTSVAGAPAAVGSTYTWDGQQLGAGRMITTAVAPRDRIEFLLEFLRPVAMTARTSFHVEPQDAQTKMQWTMDCSHEGLMGLVIRTVGLFVDMEQVYGQNLDDGLRFLKTKVEWEARR